MQNALFHLSHRLHWLRINFLLRFGPEMSSHAHSSLVTIYEYLISHTKCVTNYANRKWIHDKSSAQKKPFHFQFVHIWFIHSSCECMTQWALVICHNIEWLIIIVIVLRLPSDAIVCGPLNERRAKSICVCQWNSQEKINNRHHFTHTEIVVLLHFVWIELNTSIESDVVNCGGGVLHQLKMKY